MIDGSAFGFGLPRWVTVGAALSVYALYRTSVRRGLRATASFLPAWLLCTAASYVCSFWADDGEFVKLHIIQIYFMWVALSCYRGVRIEPGFASGATFLSILCVDIVQAVMHAEALCGSQRYCFDGVGGGGVLDVLFLVPIASVLVVHYAAWRRGMAAAARPDKVFAAPSWLPLIRTLTP